MFSASAGMYVLPSVTSGSTWEHLYTFRFDQIPGYKDLQVLQEIRDRSRDRTGWNISNSVFRVGFQNRITQTFLPALENQSIRTSCPQLIKLASVLKAMSLHMDFHSQVSAGMSFSADQERAVTALNQDYCRQRHISLDQLLSGTPQPPFSDVSVL